jgi:hypothetical protein
MSRLRNFIQHRLNAAHVYCRLCDCRIPKRAARLISAAWEACYTRPRLALAGLAVLVVLASCAVPAQAKHLHKERFYQEHWCAENAGTLEVRLPGGLRIDCETDSHAVEVDFAPKWAEAVGQSLAYAGARHKQAGILLILEKPSDARHLDKLRRVIAISGLPIDIWTITPEACAQ